MGLLDTISKVGDDVKQVTKVVKRKTASTSKDIAPVLEGAGKGAGGLLSGAGAGVGNVFGGIGKGASDVIGAGGASLGGLLDDVTGAFELSTGTKLIIGGVVVLLVVGGGIYLFKK